MRPPAMKRRAVLALPLLAATPAAAQAWPTHAVRLVVPFPPGGGTDIHARIVARRLTEALGQSVVVENRAGATGQIGYDHVAKAAPDGHTLVMATAGLTILPSLYSNLSFDPLKDLQPVSLVVRIQNVMVVHPSLPVRSLAEFLAYARANPGKVDYASTGPGNPPHLSAELLKMMTGIQMNHVPFTGDTPALTNLVGGHVQMFIAPMAGAMPHIRDGRMRAIAVTGRSRATALPAVPTFAEEGLAGYEITSWFGLMAPARTPRPILERLNAEVVRIVAMPEVRQDFIAGGSDPTSTSIAEFEAMLPADFERFARIIRASGAKLD